ncbi:hypothetical protein apy_13180 [Aeropyrum pernix]|uniref:HTH arsR-type domain-containing protein n=1 Tax=Aeropyrum pernix TaxID=56636 RepID=A0A401HAZ6_AERPX|nr:helix-turn-helix transcriptional regulator [Aeropyrum pernix]GBF09593.1 hypothetical protein apy_13180 [Aeropyrum pernix]
MVRLEDIISSRGKLKILKVLFRRGQANITLIVRETGLHHRLVSKHIEELKTANIVGERRYGRLRIIYINYGEPKARILRDIVKTLDIS